MPELPEVETVARGLQKRIIGLKITDARVTLPKITNLKPAQFRKTLIGKRITAVRRRAKVIIITLTNGNPQSRSPRGTETPPDGGANSVPLYSGISLTLNNPQYLVVHLKMSGQLLYIKSSDPVRKHTHVIISLSNGHHLRFWDQRQFGYVRFFNNSGLSVFLAEHSFGPEPLDGFTLAQFKALLQTRPNSRIKPLLMDQTFIAGIGNLYADEILFHSGVHPLRRAGQLKPVEIKLMYQGMKKILKKAIKARGSSVELYVDADGNPGNYVKYIKAYDREGKACVRCHQPIKRIKIGSRSAYFCPKCQPR